MTAKEYLSQIEKIDKLIEIKENELAQLWCNATSTTSRVSNEPGGGGISDKVGNGVVKIEDSGLRNEIALLKVERSKRIDLIKTVDNALQFAVLYKHYVSHKPLVTIADEERYTYQYIVEVHKKALKRLKF